mgnify:CR=1 FL=1
MNGFQLDENGCHQYPLLILFKLSQCAEGKWRKLRGFGFLGKVIKGVQFKDGLEVISDDQVAA